MDTKRKKRIPFETDRSYKIHLRMPNYKITMLIIIHVPIISPKGSQITLGRIDGIIRKIRFPANQNLCSAFYQTRNPTRIRTQPAHQIFSQMSFLGTEKSDFLFTIFTKSSSNIFRFIKGTNFYPICHGDKLTTRLIIFSSQVI